MDKYYQLTTLRLLKQLYGFSMEIAWVVKITPTRRTCQQLMRYDQR